MRDADEEIREIKKEIVESRGLIIRTNNLVNSLGADIKSIAKRQAGYERRFNLNSAIAYVLFASLSFAGLKLASDARIREGETEKAELEEKLAELRQELAEETRRAEQRRQAEVKAARFYDLVREGQRAEAVEAFDALRKEPLSRAETAVFKDTVDRFRRDLALSAYQTGMERAGNGRFAEAVELFQRALKLDEDGTQAPAVQLELSRSYRRMRRYGECVVVTDAVLEQGLNRDLHDDATAVKAKCLREKGDLDDARTTLRTLLRRWPGSQHAADSRREIGDLNRMIRQGNPAQTP